MSRRVGQKRTRPGKPLKATDAAIKRAMKKHDGLFSLAAADLGISRQGLHERVNANPELFAFAQELRSGHIDMAEGVLTYRMKKRHCRQSAEFILRYRGKDRGYGPQPEIEPPPPDTSRRATIVNILIQGLDRQAQAFHAQPVDVTPKPAGALNGHTPPVPAKPNGAPDPARQLLVAKKNGKG